MITYFGGKDVPLFLLTVFANGHQTNLSKSQRNVLAKLTGMLKASLGSNVKNLRKQK